MSYCIADLLGKKMNGLLQLALVIGIVALISAGSINKVNDEHSLRELIEKLEDTLEHEFSKKTPPKAQVQKRGRSPHKHMSARELMRSFKRPAKRTLNMMKTLEERKKKKLQEFAERAFENDDKKALRELVELELSRRADEDPTCDVTVDCTDSSNRVFDTEDSSAEYRTASGSCNNLATYKWGMAETQHLRWLDDAYRNGKWAERSRSVTSGKGVVVDLPSARSISNAVHSHDGATPTNTEDISLAYFQWGQFLDHDIVSTPEGEVNDNIDCCDADTTNPFCMPIVVEAGDPYFDEGYCMDARRSFTVLECDDDSGFQNQINEVTSYIDASQVYGSSDEETTSLRTFYAGLMKTSTREFPPAVNDTDEITCDEQWPGVCFATGDSRANVYPGLTTYHTVFLREHNRIATKLVTLNPDWTDETLFQQTRKIVAAEMQHITYTEFLPATMTSAMLSTYGVSTDYSYDASNDAGIASGFSIAFRYGHSLLPAEFKLQTVDATGDLTDVSVSNTSDVYLSTSVLFEHNYAGIDETATWLGYSSCPHADRYMEDAARNELFLDADGNSFDLATLNIQRGREWGTPAYTEYRDTLCGISIDPVTEWDDLVGTTHDTDTVEVLKGVYADPQDIDLWTGIVTEIPESGSLAGPTLSCIMGKQFANIKHGDRFWYETSDSTVGFSDDQLTEIQKVTLAKVLCDNLDIERLPAEVFKTSSTSTSCSDLPEMNLDQWQD